MIRVFPRRTSHTPTDELAFIGDPPLWLPEDNEVHVSVCFTWDIPEGKRLAEAWRVYYPIVKLGGPAFDSPVDNFVAGRYLKRGVTFTSRGCNNRCPFCLVPPREGKIHLMPEIAEGHIIQDNNFLQCPKEHRLKVYEMLRRQKERATFAGGIQASLVTDEIADEFRGLRIAEVFLAADSVGALRPLEQAVKRLSFLKRRQLRCYVLIAFNGETIEEAEKRLRAVWEIGCLPFAQLYRPPDKEIDYSDEWRHLARTWSRPAATFAEMSNLDKLDKLTQV